MTTRPRTVAPTRTPEPEGPGGAPASAHASTPSPSFDARPANGSGAGGERHYRRARRDRGAETRQRLIEAALDVFGHLGFEGASTRQIAKEADANLAAIVYHFGSKEALHVAVAEHIVGRGGARRGPRLAVAATPAALATPEAARAALIALLEAYADVLLGEAEAERWARFIVREQMQPSPAFEVIFGMMSRAHAIATTLVAVALGRDPAEDAVRLRTFTLIGQVLVFRLANTMVTRTMDWPAIGAAERATIKAVIVANVAAVLDAAVAP